MDYKKLKSFDCVIILTDHSNLNYNLIKKFSKKIIDTRGVYKSSSSDKNFTYLIMYIYWYLNESRLL